MILLGCGGERPESSPIPATAEVLPSQVAVSTATARREPFEMYGKFEFSCEQLDSLVALSPVDMSSYLLYFDNEGYPYVADTVNVIYCIDMDAEMYVPDLDQLSVFFWEVYDSLRVSDHHVGIWDFNEAAESQFAEVYIDGERINGDILKGYGKPVVVFPYFIGERETQTA